MIKRCLNYFPTGSSVLSEGSCRTIKVKAIQQGYTKVKVIYSHGRVLLESSITIATYDPLVVSISCLFCKIVQMFLNPTVSKEVS